MSWEDVDLLSWDEISDLEEKFDTLANIEQRLLATVHHWICEAEEREGELGEANDEIKTLQFEIEELRASCGVVDDGSDESS